jgi:hypothetical protein
MTEGLGLPGIALVHFTASSEPPDVGVAGIPLGYTGRRRSPLAGVGVSRNAAWVHCAAPCCCRSLLGLPGIALGYTCRSICIAASGWVCGNPRLVHLGAVDPTSSRWGLPGIALGYTGLIEKDLNPCWGFRNRRWVTRPQNKNRPHWGLPGSPLGYTMMRISTARRGWVAGMPLGYTPGDVEIIARCWVAGNRRFGTRSEGNPQAASWGLRNRPWVTIGSGRSSSNRVGFAGNRRLGTLAPNFKRGSPFGVCVNALGYLEKTESAWQKVGVCRESPLGYTLVNLIRTADVLGFAGNRRLGTLPRPQVADLRANSPSAALKKA